jgi:HEAT repeat protein
MHLRLAKSLFSLTAIKHSPSEGGVAMAMEGGKKREELIRQLKHSRTLPEIQATYTALGGDRETVSLLTQVLGTEEMSLRWKAAVALSDIGSGAVEDLIRCLTDEKSCVRSSAAWVLGNIGDGRAIRPLEKVLGDRTLEVRKEATEALRKLTRGRELTPSA